MIKAFIFDLDGTLVDTEPLHYAAYKEALADYGIDLKKEQFIKEWLDIGDGMETILKQFSVNVSPSIVRFKKAEIFNSRKLENLQIMPGVKEFIEACEKENIPKMIASGSKVTEIKKILKATEISSYFDEFLGCDNVENNKPHPDMYLLAAKILKLPPDQCLAFENAPSGVKSAKKAGMYCIAIPSEYSKNCDFSIADRVVESFESLNPKDLILNI